MRLFAFLLGRMLLLFSVMSAAVIVMAVLLEKPGSRLFLAPLFFSIVLSFLLSRWGGTGSRRVMEVRGGALYVVLSWLVLGMLGSLPWLMSGNPLNVAFFRSMMAVTTTMALPAGGVFALWQAVLAWMGGLHFLMLLVTAIPQVMGRSGLALSARQMVFFSPRYAKMRTGMLAVGSMYAALTAAGAVIYFFSGLTPMQSVSWAMQTISTTGGTMPFERAMDVSSVAGSGHAGIWLGRGLLEVNESALEIATVVILLLGGGNFLLYWKSITMKSFGMLIHDTELRAFLSMIVGVGLLISLFLLGSGTVPDLAEAFRDGLFCTVSFMTTSGVVPPDASGWPDFVRLLCMMLAFAGGCIGSTTGGLKTMRVVVLWKSVVQEMHMTTRPRLVPVVRVDGMLVPGKVVRMVLTLFFLYFAFFLLGAVVLALFALEPSEALGLSAACLTSTGGIAELFGVGAGAMLAMPAAGQMVAVLLMVAGRAEIMSLLIVVGAVAERTKKKEW